jgi:hypothetical protein
MLDRSDIQGRLRLFRYGLIVVVVVTFLVSLFAPVAALRDVPTASPVSDFLGTAIMFTVIVAIIAIVTYCAYFYFLTKKWPWASGGSSDGGAAA